MYDRVVARASQNPEPNKSTLVSSKPKELTLEEKRRMVSNQQQSRMLNQSDQINSQPRSSMKALPSCDNSQVKDLTSTLIANNINGLASSGQMALPWNASQPQTAPNCFSNTSIAMNQSQYQNQMRPNYYISTNAPTTNNPWPPQNVMMHPRPMQTQAYHPPRASGPMQLPQQGSVKPLSQSDINDLLS
ncbi:hypothetical protein Ciccas_003648 [Cichlidogyrus casuarinus]|uniref:Uncharacterized protein n=1 Tax=Cichlidogyrus casuarinus TaxID=1844966 RepID=A0ABD2QDT9_9PLAT